MNVSMDGLRRQLARDYSNLVSTLNDNIRSGDVVRVDAFLIQDELATLRQNIAILMCVFDDEEDDFSELSEEAMELPHFNNNQ